MTIRCNGALRGFACGVFLCALGTAVFAQKPPDPPAPPWKDFVKTKGHDNEIPAQWVATPEGRFAHDIVLPSSIPKTVPFDFKAAKLRALKPGAKSASKQYWEHLCNTEAGSFILKPVENVDGFFFMRPVVGLDEHENNDRWKAEAPGMQSSWPPTYNPMELAELFVDPPSATYEWVDAADAGDGVSHLSQQAQPSAAMSSKHLAESSAQYGITWRGIRRQRDREEAVAGVEWIAIDMKSGTVQGAMRDFYLTGRTRNRSQGIYWLNALRCPFSRELFGRINELRDTGLWAAMVLRPVVYPGVLKFLDDQRRSKR